jgi:hypothetical protein
VGATVERLAPDLLGREGRQRHHPDVWGAAAQLGDQVGAVHPWHAEVQHDHVGLLVGGQLQRLAAVAGLADQVEAPSLQGHAQQGPQLGDVVGDQDPDRCLGLEGRGHAHSLATGSRAAMLTLRVARTNRPDEYS